MPLDRVQKVVKLIAVGSAGGIAVGFAALLRFIFAMLFRGGEYYVTAHGGTVSHDGGAAYVYWCEADLEDVDLTYVVQIRCLTILSLSGNQKITDEGLQVIAGNARDLAIFDVSDTSVTEDGVQDFVNRFPNCGVEWRGTFWSGRQRY